MYTNSWSNSMPRRGNKLIRANAHALEKVGSLRGQKDDDAHARLPRWVIFPRLCEFPLPFDVCSSSKATCGNEVSR